jgi:disulfide bond formation protein DsbB
MEQRMSSRFGFWIAHFNILAICAVLIGAFVVQFGQGEFPCPLCILQRMAMILCALGPAYVIMKARDGEVKTSDFATGYGMSVVAAVGGASISIRQILLHIVPPDPGFGEPVLGMHLYTWALIVFVAVLVDSGLNLVFAHELAPQGVEFGWPSRLVLWLLGAIIVANAIAVFAEEGLHWTLPDDPDSYRLFDLLRG